MKFIRVSNPDSEIEKMEITDPDEIYVICAMIKHFSGAPVGDFPAAINGWGREVTGLHGLENIALNTLSKEVSETKDWMEI